MAVGQEKSAELVARLERLPFSRWHRNFFVLAFFGIMFDAMDFALFGAALPPIAREFGLGPAQSGLLATVGLIGAFVGALFWGTFSDYIGRRTAFQATVGIFALFTGLMAVTWNVGSLIVFRFLSNFGLGGEVPVTTTLASEFSPGRIRGALTGNILAAFPVGLIVAALLSLLIIPTLGWRALFIVGVVPAVLLFFVRWYMPESVRYLLSKGRVAEAEHAVRSIEEKALGRPLSAEEIRTVVHVKPEVAVPSGVTVFELFAPGRRRTTVLAWIVSFAFLWASNGILFMLPTILTERGIPLTQAISFQLVQAIGGFFGYSACSFLIDRYGRRPVLFLYYFVGAFLSSVVRHVERLEYVRCRVSRRVGQSGRFWSKRDICQRAAPDPYARYSGRLVLRHRPDRVVPCASCYRVHAGLRVGRLHPLHVCFGLSDRIIRTHCDRHRDKGPGPGGDHRRQSDRHSGCRARQLAVAGGPGSLRPPSIRSSFPRSHRHHDMGAAGAGSRRVCACARHRGHVACPQALLSTRSTAPRPWRDGCATLPSSRQEQGTGRGPARVKKLRHGGAPSVAVD
jgi:MFS transporter, putative metabolite:H+ symporter